MSTSPSPTHRLSSDIERGAVAATVLSPTAVPRERVSLHERLTAVLPTGEDSIAAEPPALAPADRQAVRALHVLHGPGPLLDRLTDDEHAALIGHLSRLDEAIARFDVGGIDESDAAEHDWPFDLEHEAERQGAYTGGSTSGWGDDPREIDYATLAVVARDHLADLRAGWIEAAEAYSNARPAQ